MTFAPAHRPTAPQQNFSRTGSASIRSRGVEPLELETIRRVTPSVFAEQAHDSRSQKYAYIPTSEILVALAKEGFHPFSVVQGGSRDEIKKGFTKHTIRLRHASNFNLTAIGQTANEIILLNSHDGTSSYQMSGGVFRLTCLNGMVVADSLVERVKVAHKGDVQGLVIDGCIEIMSQLPAVSESIEQMRALELTGTERRIFATAAHHARYGYDVAPIQAAELLTVKRRDDSPPTLWNTLNVVQENLIKGGIPYIQRNAEGQRVARRETRPVNGIDQNTALNRTVWSLAEQLKAGRAEIMAELAAMR